MSFFKKIANSINGGDDDNYQDDYNDYEADEEYDDPDEGNARQEQRQETKRETRERQERYQYRAPEQPQQRSYQQTAGISLEMKVIKPENKLDSVNMIGEHIMKGRTVIINFEETNKEIMTRIIDFIGGLCYATGAQLKRSSSYTFILSPKNVQVSSDQVEDRQSADQQKELF